MKIEERVTALERAVGVADPSEAEAITKQRAAAADEAKEIKRQLLARVRQDETDVLALVADYQKTAQLLVEQIGNIRRLRGTQRVRCGELASWIPNGLAPNEIDRHLFGLLAELIWENSNRRNDFGAVTLVGCGGLFSGTPEQDWSEVASKVMGRHLDALRAETE